LSQQTLIDSSSQEEQLHIIDQPWTLSNWHNHLNWLHVVILVGVPLLGVYGWMTTEIRPKTLVWAVIYYFMTGLGITAGFFLSSDIH
jgi:stearoyl-CoA desaturase (delta-9 desaturase)